MLVCISSLTILLAMLVEITLPLLLSLMTTLSTQSLDLEVLVSSLLVPSTIQPVPLNSLCSLPFQLLSNLFNLPWLNKVIFRLCTGKNLSIAHLLVGQLLWYLHPSYSNNLSTRFGLLKRVMNCVLSEYHHLVTTLWSLTLCPSLNHSWKGFTFFLLAALQLMLLQLSKSLSPMNSSHPRIMWSSAPKTTLPQALPLRL